MLYSLRGLSDRTINGAISQLRFFTLYVLYKPWDDTQLPMRRFDEYFPFVPSKEETWQFISSMPDLKPKTMVTLMYSSGLRIGEVCRLRYEDVDRKHMRLHIIHSIRRYLMHVLPPGFQKIRYYGFLNNRYKTRNLKLIFALQGHQRFKAKYTSLSMAELLKAVWNININICPECGYYNVRHIERTYGTS